MIPAGLCSWPFHLLLLPPCQISSCIQPRASCYNPCDKNTHHTIQEVIFSLCRKTPLQGTGLAELFSKKDFVLSTKRGKHTTDFMHPVQLLFSLTRLLKFSRKCQIPWAAQGCRRGSGQHCLCSLCAFFIQVLLEEKDKTIHMLNLL